MMAAFDSSKLAKMMVKRDKSPKTQENPYGLSSGGFRGGQGQRKNGTSSGARNIYPPSRSYTPTAGQQLKNRESGSQRQTGTSSNYRNVYPPSRSYDPTPSQSDKNKATSSRRQTGTRRAV